MYAVHKGLSTGVFDTWEETKKVIDGVQGAVCLKCDTLGEALFFAAHGYPDDNNWAHSQHICIKAERGFIVVRRHTKHEHMIPKHMLGAKETEYGVMLKVICQILTTWVDQPRHDTRFLQIDVSNISVINTMNKYIPKWILNDFKFTKEPTYLQLIKQIHELHQKLPCEVKYVYLHARG